MTSRSRGSYEPAPAPTFTTVRASPSASQMGLASRGSSTRTAAYPWPIASYRAMRRSYCDDESSSVPRAGSNQRGDVFERTHHRAAVDLTGNAKICLPRRSSATSREFDWLAAHDDELRPALTG